MHKFISTFVPLAFVASASYVAAIEDRVSKCEKAIYRHAEVNDINSITNKPPQDTLYKAIENMCPTDYIDYVTLVEGKPQPSVTQVNNYINETYQINKEYNDAKHKW